MNFPKKVIHQWFSSSWVERIVNAFIVVCFSLKSTLSFPYVLLSVHCYQWAGFMMISCFLISLSKDLTSVFFIFIFTCFFPLKHSLFTFTSQQKQSKGTVTWYQIKTYYSIIFLKFLPKNDKCHCRHKANQLGHCCWWGHPPEELTLRFSWRLSQVEGIEEWISSEIIPSGAQEKYVESPLLSLQQVSVS